MKNFDVRLDGQIALVTGASRGIGRGCCVKLAEAGAKVIAVARSEVELADLSRDYPGSIEPWVWDVTNPGFIKQLDELKQLNILVNNVGTNQPQPFVDVTEAALDGMLDLNVRTAFLTAQSAARVMLKHRCGSIVHVSSQMGHVGAVNRSAYCMTKHAIEGLSKAMAVELAEQGIRVNCVAPTFVETPLTAPMLEDEKFKAAVLEKIPMRRLASIENVANAVLFLASEAAAMVTGDSLKVDGGWTAH